MINVTRSTALNLTLSAMMALLLASCASEKPKAPARPKVAVTTQVKQLLPSSVSNKTAWSEDIYQAFLHQQIDANVSNLCAVIAVAGQETNFNADAPVKGLPQIAWQEIYRRAGSLHIPEFVVRTALKIPSTNGKSYTERLDTVRSERELSDIFDDLIDSVPLGQRLFGRFNPIHTGGPMQVSIAFAEQHAEDYPYKVEKSIRKEVLTQRGGVYFGTLHLLGYPTHYSVPLYRFADYNAGWYASRNAAFQAAVSYLSGQKLALDGDLIQYQSDAPSHTELAIRSIRSTLQLSDSAIHQQLSQGESFEFEQSQLWKKVFSAADKKRGQAWPHERLPGITLESPKISRNLTTAWFAQRVNQRYQHCLLQAREE